MLSQIERVAQNRPALTSNTGSEQSVDTTWPLTSASHCAALPSPVTSELDWLVLDPGAGAAGSAAGATSSAVELDESWLELEEPSPESAESWLELDELDESPVGSGAGAGGAGAGA
ncbi:MAG: hypothetical protein ACRCZP_00960, partial [Phycicoccus sp.]